MVSSRRGSVAQAPRPSWGAAVAAGDTRFPVVINVERLSGDKLEFVSDNESLGFLCSDLEL